MKRILMMAVMLVVMAAPAFASGRSNDSASDSAVLKVTNENYKALTEKNQLLVVDFWASWCGPCRAIAPIVEELAAEYKGKVAIGKCNVDENRELTSSFGVRGIPAIYFIKNGKVVDEQIGYCDKDALKAKIDQLLKK